MTVNLASSLVSITSTQIRSRSRETVERDLTPVRTGGPEVGAKLEAENHRRSYDDDDDDDVQAQAKM